MANELIQPDRFFLNRFGLNERAFERTLGTALERKADYADLYFEFRSSEALTLEESIVSKTAKSVSQGVGVQGLRGGSHRLCLFRRGDGGPDAPGGGDRPRDRR